MNYLAGFLIVIVADSVMSERQNPTATGHANDPAGAVSFTSAALGATNGVSQSSEAYNAVSQAAASKGGGDSGTGPTAEEMELIEKECVQAMLGMVALQGGVLSRDLWGLHAVSWVFLES